MPCALEKIVITEVSKLVESCSSTTKYIFLFSFISVCSNKARQDGDFPPGASTLKSYNPLIMRTC